MDSIWRELIRQHTGAAIEMLENAIAACPDWLWDADDQQPAFWYLAYHTIFFLDFYASDPAGFAPPAPFTLSELDPSGVLPDRTYSKDELLSYLAHGRRKHLALLDTLTAERVTERRDYAWLQTTLGELAVITLRHLQHHTAQLNLILRQRTDSAPPWVKAPRDRVEASILDG
ncbi:MAG TPA: DinB family protein [Longimicrobium sp.]|nr:DinB family protein [Longimicrobium sp.]